LCKNDPVSAAPLTRTKIRGFWQFTQVNLARFDRLRKALKSPKPPF